MERRREERVGQACCSAGGREAFRKTTEGPSQGGQEPGSERWRAAGTTLAELGARAAARGRRAKGGSPDAARGAGQPRGFTPRPVRAQMT